MTTTETYSFDLENADIIDEAFERIGKDPDSIIGRHLSSALRSIAVIFSSWAARGVKQWKIEKFTFTSTNGFASGTTSITLDPRVMRVITAVHRTPDGYDTVIRRTARDDYEYLHDKDQTASRPDRYFLDRKIPAPEMYLWPAINTSTDSLVITALVRMQDAGSLSNTLDIPFYWWDAICCALAEKLAEKYAPERLAEKRTLAEDAFQFAIAEDRDVAPTRIRMKFKKR